MAWIFVDNIEETDISLMPFFNKMVCIHSPRPEEYSGDTSDFPRFVEHTASIGRSLRSAFGDLAGLLVWNILLAGLAFSAFLRTDVR
jgi:hypothetical protein